MLGDRKRYVSVCFSSGIVAVQTNDGAGDVFIHTKHNSLRVSPPPTQVVDTTGGKCDTTRESPANLSSISRSSLYTNLATCRIAHDDVGFDQVTAEHRIRWFKC